MLSFLNRLFESDEVIAVVVAAFLASIGFIVRLILRPRANVQCSAFHQQRYELSHEQGPITIFTRDFFFQNSGKSSAPRLQLVFNYEPQHYRFVPPIPFSTQRNPDDRFIVEIQNLNPKEFFELVLLSVGHEIPLLLSVRWEGGIGNPVPMVAQPIQSSRTRIIQRVLMFAGATGLLFAAIRAAQLIF